MKKVRMSVKHKFHADGSVPNIGGSFIFVFGSNTAGRHGAGAARVAREHFGAKAGVGFGPMGHSYAIPTKKNNAIDPFKLDVLSLAEIQKSVEAFLEYAALNPSKSFWVTRVGCGLAGYSDQDIGVMFSRSPENCNLPIAWGTYVTQQPYSPSAKQGVTSDVLIQSEFASLVSRPTV